MPLAADALAASRLSRIAEQAQFRSIKHGFADDKFGADTRCAALLLIWVPNGEHPAAPWG